MKRAPKNALTGAFGRAISRWTGLGERETEGRVIFRSGFQGRLHEVRIGCRNPRERCDAVFLENLEPCSFARSVILLNGDTDDRQDLSS